MQCEIVERKTLRLLYLQFWDPGVTKNININNKKLEKKEKKFNLLTKTRLIFSGTCNFVLLNPYSQRGGCRSLIHIDSL